MIAGSVRRQGGLRRPWRRARKQVAARHSVRIGAVTVPAVGAGSSWRADMSSLFATATAPLEPNADTLTPRR
ncbi:hypothetical protein [Streptomyces sp. NPDC058632]|uniref:hypothetical protein n=1 Tax=unclassified Streptomyces TaxID=2593676 RepID=UPI0036588D27